MKPVQRRYAVRGNVVKIDDTKISLVGMEMNKARRGNGLSTVFIAIWLRICLETGTYPRAAVMSYVIDTRMPEETEENKNDY